MEELTDEQKYFRAKAKVDKLRGFYSHFIVYILVNLFITIMKVRRNINNGETFEEAFYDFNTGALCLFWGIGIAFHAFSVFGFDYFLGKNWEDEKLEQFIKDEEEHLKQQD
jgi:hypothetical protein